MFRNRARGHGYRRGLVERVTATGRRVLSNASTWFRLAPIRSLTVVDVGTRMDRLADLAELCHLDELHLRQNHLSNEDARVLAAAPHLAQLSKLDLRSNHIGLAGAQALAAAPYLDRLTELDLLCNPIGAEGAAALRERFGQRVQL
jgi:hypothetical protein